jgi:phosphoglycolate phosphatase
MTIWFDFDGTLIDVRAKYFALYRAFMAHYGIPPLADELFWTLKRKGVENMDIAMASGLGRDQATLFSHFIEERVELETSLRRDTLFADVSTVFAMLTRRHSCHLLSMRRSYKMLLCQLDWLGIRNWFGEVLEVQNTTNGSFTPKAQALRCYGVKTPALIIGDSGMEVKSGRQLGIITCAITRGIRDREFLANLRPDFIVESLVDMLPLIEKLETGQ